MSLGIQETKELFLFGASFGNALGKSLADGKFNLSDIANFIDPATKIPAAFKGIGQVDNELADLDEAEKLELIEYAKTEFDIPDEDAEVFVEDSLELAFSIYSFLQKHFIKE